LPQEARPATADAAEASTMEGSDEATPRNSDDAANPRRRRGRHRQ